MAATVQATCPGCQNVLRIPADWADRTMRCKKCGAVMQGRRKDPPPAAAPAFDPARQPYPQQQPYGYPPQGYAPPGYPPQAYGPPPGYPQPMPVPPSEEFPNPLDDGPSRRKYRRGQGGGRVLTVGIVIVLAVALVGGGMLINKNLEKEKESKKLVPQAGKARGGAGVAGGTADKGDPADAGGKPVNPLTRVGEAFPRRLLFIHVSNYIYFNHLSPGTSAGKDMPTKSAEKMAFEFRVPNAKDDSQLFVLCDTAGAKDFRPPMKAVVRHAYEQFFATSREQDRVVVYFGGHAVEREGKAYLVPVEGEPDAPETLIPLDDFYAKLKECKAQQKVVFFDVCRLDPDRGEEKPGGEKMTEDLAKLLLAAPPGVTAGLSCGPGQNAQETNETGSEFLTAFRVTAERARRTGKAPPPKPEDPIPAAQWLDGLRAYLAEPRMKLATQSVKANAGEPGPVVAFNKDEALGKRFDWPAPPKGVSTDEVIKVLQQVSLPGIRQDLSVPADLPRVYPFPEEVMKAYAADDVTDDMIDKNPAKYPVRKAALDALKTIGKVWKAGGDAGGGLMESFDGDIDDKLKKSIQDQQLVPAKINLELKETIEAMDEAAKKLGDEKSKRWQAVFLYAHAQAQLRWAFMNEYDAVLGKIRTDSLPRAENGQKTSLKLVSVAKPSRKDTKEKVDAAKETLEKLAADHKGTPYEVLAKLHKHISVGLEWRLVQTEVAKDADAK